jgi:hypothetical protein
MTLPMTLPCASLSGSPQTQTIQLSPPAYGLATASLAVLPALWSAKDTTEKWQTAYGRSQVLLNATTTT